jgi:hypothetical protein
VGEVFAGFVCGYALAIASTPLLAILLLRLRTGNELMMRLLPAGTSTAGLGVILHGGLFLFWTAAGILLGLVLLAMGDTRSALGSAHPPFSLFVLGLALAFSAPLIALLPPARAFAIVAAILVVVIFGWLMPHMAGWSNFEPPPEEPLPRYEVFHAWGK